MLIYDEDCFFGSGYTEVFLVSELREELDESDKKKLDKLIEKYDKIQSEKEENKVTERQQNCINMICENLNMEQPQYLTKKSAREFISEHIEESKKAHKKQKELQKEANVNEDLYDILDESLYY